jgi:hypothetical protein
MATKKKTGQYAIIANQSYGLYVGIVDAFDTKEKTVKARGVRHVARWYGKTGGITSLAVHGLCGPDADKSKIGAPVATATLTGIVNVFECTAEARATFEAAKQQ